MTVTLSSSIKGGNIMLSDNTYNDDVSLLLGTGEDASLSYRNTGAGATTNSVYYGVPTASPAVMYGDEANKGFDHVGVDISGFLQGPTYIYFSGNQALNQHARFTQSSSQFSFNSASGDHLDGTATDAKGIAIAFNSGAGGTDSGTADGAPVTFSTGDSGGAGGQSGDIIFTTGAANGGALGQIVFNQDSTQRLQIGASGDTMISVPDNQASAFYVIQNADKYIEVDTSNGAEVVTFGNTATNPAFTFAGSGSITPGGRVLGLQGADVASGATITLINGNYFDVTGTTQIDNISGAGWTAGSLVTLQFDASVTVKHNTAGAGAPLQLAGAVDFSATAGDTLMVVYDGTYFREVSRSVI